ncbi:hypothetical protein E3N88_00702 [Mikania micrantha]|uniref:Uncharacterized protein n=1 Tax=Mikania micrantha TaxID=192012 RepID=A0A5N6Q0J8_9ASTR|nr:hypothetical protein E3N88_00702 [Mikania micrantha]
MMNVGENRARNGVTDCPESRNEEKSKNLRKTGLGGTPGVTKKIWDLLGSRGTPLAKRPRGAVKSKCFKLITIVAKVGLQGRVLAPRSCFESDYFMSITRVLPPRVEYSPITRSKELFRPRNAK